MGYCVAVSYHKDDDLYCHCRSLVAKSMQHAKWRPLRMLDALIRRQTRQAVSRTEIIFQSVHSDNGVCAVSESRWANQAEEIDKAEPSNGGVLHDGAVHRRMVR